MIVGGSFDIETFCKETYKSASRIGYSLGRMLGLDDSTIADAIQDAYVHVLSNRAELEALTASHRVGNLCTTVRYKLLSAYRELCPRRSINIDDVDEMRDPSDDIDNLVLRLSSQDELLRVAKALHLLIPEHRELIALLVTDEINNGSESCRAERDRRIAEQLGKTEGAIRAQRMRAVAALRQVMERQAGPPSGKEGQGS